MDLVAGWALTDGLKTRSDAFANSLVIDPATGVLIPVSGTLILDANLTSPVAGVATEIELARQVSVEFMGLYRPLRARDIATLSNGATTERRFTVLTWEFPLLAKYRLPSFNIGPFLELGPSLRASGNLNGTRPSHHGITAGIGMELRQHKLSIAPALRFTHWAADDNLHGKDTRRNQVEMVFGVRF